MKKTRSISQTFMTGMVAVAVLTTMLSLGIALFNEYSAFNKECSRIKSEYIQDQETIVRYEVNRAIDIINYRRQHTRLPEQELKERLLQRLSMIRFPNRGDDPGILFIRSYDGTLLMSVSKPELVGKDTSKLTDPEGINTHEQFMMIIKNPQGGYADYSWYNPVTKKVEPKRTFVKGIPGWQWYIGAGFWFDDINSVIDHKKLELKHAVEGYVVTIVLALLVMFAFVYMIARNLSKKIKGNFDGFSSFFKKAATQSAVIDLETLHFTEFIDLASSANQMVIERKQAEAEKRNMEAQLLHAQKMEAIGTLAGGIAHDFNNLLTAVQGNASLMLMHVAPGDDGYEKLKSIEQCVGSGAALTKQLLGFARGGSYDVRPIDLNELVRETSKMFGRTKKEIAIHEKYPGNLWTVEADSTQIEQVLLNLYVNTWQAMPAGGDLYLETENVDLDEDYVRVYEMGPGRYVKISVTNTGVGMDEATRTRVFDPFFTTKEMGRGTGLGLTSAYGIIRHHKGIINVYSEKGHGTTFSIYLPASNTALQTSKISEDKVQPGEGTILLVDDEGMIIDVGSSMLESFGYKVLTAASGQEAVEVYKENKDTIDLVILDMIIPGLGGSETFDRLREINPDIRVILSSGYSLNGRASSILERGCSGFIQKPFNMRGLSRKIKEIIDKEPDI